jgi:hypothetical protein
MIAGSGFLYLWVMAVQALSIVRHLIEYMSYLKIFPRSIIVKQDGEGGYVGRITYDFEHYGRMMFDDDSDVELFCRWYPRAEWFIRSRETVHRFVGFALFMNALNHYLFEVLQFDPVSQWCKVSDADYAYYFERVYFDMGTHKFKVVNKLSVADTAESRRGFWRIKA